MPQQKIKVLEHLSLSYTKEVSKKLPSASISDNLKNLVYSPNNIIYQKRFVDCVYYSLYPFYVKKVSFDDFESIIQDTCCEMIKIVISGKEITEGIIRNFAYNRYKDILKHKNRKKRLNKSAAQYLDIYSFDVAANSKNDYSFIEDLGKILPKDEHFVIDKKISEDLSFSEISQLNKKSVSTNYRLFKSGLKRLKKYF